MSSGQLNDSFLLESKVEKSNDEMPTTITKSGSLSSLTSLTSIISIDTSTVRIKKASLSVNYSICIKNSVLIINLISLENIKSVLKLNDCCVYVKLEVLFINSNENSEQKQMAKTRLLKNQSSPVYDELFEFRSSSGCDDLELIRIAFQICNSNSFGRDQLIGLKEHIIDKKDLTVMIHSEPFMFRMFSQCIDLLDAKENFQLGQIHVRLLYKKLTKTLCIHLIQATRLQIPLSYASNDKIPSKTFSSFFFYFFV